jgi:hypothetical protein
LIEQYGVPGASIAILFHSLVLCLIAALALSKLKIKKLRYTKLIINFTLLGVVSSPLMNYIGNETSGSKGLVEKALIFTAFSIAFLLPNIQCSIKALRLVESDIKK